MSREPQGPCKGCNDRSVEPNCHNAAICEKWAEFQREKEEDRKLRTAGWEARAFRKSSVARIRNEYQKKGRD